MLTNTPRGKGKKVIVGESEQTEAVKRALLVEAGCRAANGRKSEKGTIRDCGD